MVGSTPLIARRPFSATAHSPPPCRPRSCPDGPPPHVRFVPDHPMADAALVVLGHAADESLPEAMSGTARLACLLASRRVPNQACRSANPRPRGRQPARRPRADRHVGGLPVLRSGRLDHVPAQNDARKAHAGLACSCGIDKALDDSKPGIRRRSFGPPWEMAASARTTGP